MIGTALGNYLFSGLAGSDIADEFDNLLRNRHKPYTTTFNIESLVDSLTMIDINHDKHGAKITSDHKLYKLQNIIKSFQAGERTTLKQLQYCDNPQEYFKDKGPHFSAGYLSRFGKVAKENLGKPYFPFVLEMKWGLRKMREEPYYRAASRVWKDYFDNKLMVVHLSK